MLTIEAINVHYDASQALKQAYLQAEIVQVMSIMGRNGVGKTTLLTSAADHIPTSAGLITWQGIPIDALAP